jgi:glutamate-ammonia-ligase adenylyltransferase
MLRIVESIGRRSAYIALLNENQVALERLVNLCASSEFLARQIAAHPLLLDELLDQRVFLEAPTKQSLQQEARQRLDHIDLEDSEQRFETLRNFQQAAVFRIAVADLSGTLPLMRVSDRLTNVAEIVLQAAIDMSLAELSRRHGEPRCTVNGRERPAGFAIAGYGKLGGWELGYGSDLDIVFMHDSEGENQQTDGDSPLDNAVFFARVARRITNILAMHTPTGPLYEVDTRLRPSGNSGLLVTSLHALDSYQRDDAWTWEHQALLRARAVAGSEAVCDEFQKLRVHALTEYVRHDSLAEEVVKMRGRMRKELSKSTAELFDIKQGEGGMIDIEFLVQYLVLLNAPKQPSLLTWSDNIRQLEALGKTGLLDPAEADELAEIYRAYRTRVHLLSLAGEPRLAPNGDFADYCRTVQALWQRFLPAAGQA